MRRIGPVLIALAALAGSAPAPAATVYYGCGNDICRIAPDGTGKQTVASGRTYHSPTVSLDGRHLAWVEPTADLFTGDGAAGNPVGPLSRFAVYAIISPDGTQVLAFENAGQPARVCVYPIAGGDCDSHAGGSVSSGGWAPGNRVMISTREFGDPAFTEHHQDYNNRICLLKPHGGETGGECESNLAYDADSELDDPALSPDGSTLAVSRAPWDHQDQGQIALFDVATGNLKQVLTSGPGDATPFWSPDGAQIAFSRDGGIYVIAASGPEGSERRIADGTLPTWANVGGAAAAPKVTVAARQRGFTVRGTAKVAKAGSRLLVQLVYREKGQAFVVGHRLYRSVGAGTRPFAAALDRKVRRALHGIRSIPLLVRVTLTPPGGSAVTVTRHVTLRLR